jgi:hypothetical protein
MRRVDGTSALASPSQLETEFEKDRWDVRNIGCSYPPHSSNYYIDFQRIPRVFLPLAKEYTRFQVAEGKAAKTLIRCAYCLSNFFIFFSARYPDTNTLHALSLPDIDVFIASLKEEANARGLKDIPQHVRHHLYFLEGFLCHLERTQHPNKPDEPTSRIIWSSHYPHWDKRGSGKMKYIPQTVLAQLDTHLQHLSPTCIPIAHELRNEVKLRSSKMQSLRPGRRAVAKVAEEAEVWKVRKNMAKQAMGGVESKKKSRRKPPDEREASSYLSSFVTDSPDQEKWQKRLESRRDVFLPKGLVESKHCELVVAPRTCANAPVVVASRGRSHRGQASQRQDGQ